MGVSKRGLQAWQFRCNIAKLWWTATDKWFASECPFIGEL
jgi:hypothetical protein